jgi:hypothetical protein
MARRRERGSAGAIQCVAAALNEREETLRAALTVDTET